MYLFIIYHLRRNAPEAGTVYGESICVFHLNALLLGSHHVFIVLGLVLLSVPSYQANLISKNYATRSRHALNSTAKNF